MIRFVSLSWLYLDNSFDETSWDAEMATKVASSMIGGSGRVALNGPI